MSLLAWHSTYGLVPLLQPWQPSHLPLMPNQRQHQWPCLPGFDQHSLWQQLRQWLLLVRRPHLHPRRLVQHRRASAVTHGVSASPGCDWKQRVGVLPGCWRSCGECAWWWAPF